MEEERKFKKEILAGLDRMNENYSVKLKLETTKQSQDISSLREETQQSIQIINVKINS
jgi:hypothetical protein